MVAIEEAYCSRCNRAWIARDAGPNCFARAFGIPSEHDWVVPLSAIEVAFGGLDGVIMGAVHDFDPQWDSLVDVLYKIDRLYRHAMLGDKENDDDE